MKYGGMVRVIALGVLFDVDNGLAKILLVIQHLSLIAC